MTDEGGWARMGYLSWADVGEVRARLAAGADPDATLRSGQRPLHMAAEWGAAEVVAELAAAGAEVEADADGRSPLWIAVQAGQTDSARALVAAGADPWREMMSGWSPGRLSLAGRTPDLFDRPPGTPGLTEGEQAAATESRRLIDAIGSPDYEGLSLCCVAGVDAAEAVRRLGAHPLKAGEAEALTEALLACMPPQERRPGPRRPRRRRDRLGPAPRRRPVSRRRPGRQDPAHHPGSFRLRG